MRAGKRSPRKRIRGERIISIEGLTKRFGKRTVLDRISLEVKEGELLCLLGENGAGKTTLLKTLATLLRPTEGDALVGGFSVCKDALEVRKLVGYCSESFIYDELTVRENLQFYSNVRSDNRNVDEQMEDYGLGSRSGEPAGKLSMGYRQRLALARATFGRPKVLLLDEPYSGLDHAGARMLNSRLLKLKGSSTIILVTHDEGKLNICDSAAIIMKGKANKYSINEAKEMLAEARS